MRRSRPRREALGHSPRGCNPWAWSITISAIKPRGCNPWGVSPATSPCHPTPYRSALRRRGFRPFQQLRNLGPHSSTRLLLLAEEFFQLLGIAQAGQVRVGRERLGYKWAVARGLFVRMPTSAYSTRSAALAGTSLPAKMPGSCFSKPKQKNKGGGETPPQS